MKNILHTKYFKSSKWLYIIWPYLALLVLHLIFVMQAQQPWLWKDEFIQLEIARYFIEGEGDILFAEMPYAHFGYTFLIAPAFWFFSDPGNIYKAMVSINAILASALYFPLYYLLRNLAPLSKKIATIITLATCLYPAFMIQSIIVWQDAVIFTFYATSFALLLYFFRKPSYLNIILFSASVGFLYMMHARVLPIILVSIIFLLFLSAYKKELRKKLFLGTTIIILFFVATKFINAHLLSVLWQGNYIPYSIPEILNRIASFDGIKIFFTRALGQILYLLQATYGLFFFGLAYLIQYIWKNKKNTFKETLKDEKILVLVYLLITSLGVFVVSILFNAVPDLPRPDQLIYGRYNELFLAPFISLGLLGFYLNKNNKWHYLIITLLVLFSSFLLGKEIFNMEYGRAPNSIVGIFLWIYAVKKINVLLISAISLSFFLIFIKAFSRKFFYGIFMLFILFGMHISVAYFAYSNLYKNYLPANELLPYFKDLDLSEAYYVYGHLCDDDRVESYQFFIDYNRVNYNWQVPNIKFYTFDDQAVVSPKYEYVIASHCWKSPANIHTQLIKKDDSGIQAIWKIKK